MSSVVTSRLDEGVKQRSIEILAKQGITLSLAVQGLFDYVVKHESLPYEIEEQHRDSKAALQKLAALKDARIPEGASIPVPQTDLDIKLDRLEERYGLALR